MTPDVVAKFRDRRLAEGLKANTIRLDLALLGHLFSTAITDWRIGLVQNPVHNIRKSSPGDGRTRRLFADEEKRLRKALGLYSNPMLRWIFDVALETAMPRVGDHWPSYASGRFESENRKTHTYEERH